MKTYETIVGGQFLAHHYPEKMRVRYRAYLESATACSDLVAREKMVMALRSAKACGEYDLALFAMMSHRETRRAWLAVTQRKWQGKCRSEARARHHDSVSIREKYVRCEA